jgi:hypothetical protein
VLNFEAEMVKFKWNSLSPKIFYFESQFKQNAWTTVTPDGTLFDFRTYDDYSKFTNVHIFSVFTYLQVTIVGYEPYIEKLAGIIKQYPHTPERMKSIEDV